MENEYLKGESGTPKEIVSTEQLRDLIQNRISSGNDLDGDCKDVVVNSVYWHEPDETGSNWEVHSLSNATGCEEAICAIINTFKDQYNVEEPG